MPRLANAVCFFSLLAAPSVLAQTAFNPDSVVTIPAAEAVVPPPAPSAVAPPASDAHVVPSPAADSSVAAPPASASPEPDSSETVSSASTTLPVTVVLKDGTERHYVRAEVSGSYLVCWRPDGGTDNIKVSKVARILGDQTADVLKAGSTAGKKEKKSDKPFLRGRPLPEMKSFLVVQAGALARADKRSESEEDGHAWLELGRMKNLSPRFALGGTAGVADDGRSYTRITLKPRLRAWIGKGYAFDLAAGAFFPVGQSAISEYPEEVKPGSTGFTGEVSFVANDWVSASYVVEVIGVEKATWYHTFNPETFGVSRTSGTEVYHYIGLKAGGGVGLFLAVLTFAGLFANN